MSSKILLVTQEEGLREQFGDRLVKEGYKVDVASNAEEVKEILKYKRFCLYIIDVDLPDSSGFRLCKFIRQISRNPMMCISDYEDDSTIVRCLRNGADACVKKPFVMRVMLERVKALLRRSVNEENDSTYIYITGNLVFDIDCREVFYQNRKLKMTKGEFNLLSILVRNTGRVVDRNAMMEAVSGEGTAVYEDNTLSVRMSRLREKLKKIDGEKYFTTVRGVGYRWEKPVEKELKRC